MKSFRDIITEGTGIWMVSSTNKKLDKYFKIFTKAKTEEEAIENAKKQYTAKTYSALELSDKGAKSVDSFDTLIKEAMDKDKKNGVILVNERYKEQGTDLMNEMNSAGIKFNEWTTDDWLAPMAIEFKLKDLDGFSKFEDEFEVFNEGQFQSQDKEVITALSFVVSNNRKIQLIEIIGHKGL